MVKYKNWLYNILIIALLMAFIFEVAVFYVFNDDLEHIIFIISITFVPLFLMAVIILKIITIKQDRKLSELARFQHQLRLKDTRFAEDSDKVQTYVWEIDRSGMLKYVSDSIESVLGYKPSELINKKTIWFLNPKPLQADFKKIALDAMANHKSIASLENPVITKDGQTVWVVSGILPVFDKEGQLTGLQGFDINVTESKEIEEAFIKSERKFRSLFETMGEAFVLLEAVRDDNNQLINYRILEANKAYIEQTGLEDTHVINQLITDVFNVEQPPFLDKYDLVDKTGDSVSFTRYFAPLEKHYRLSIYQPKKNHFATVLTDITKEKTLKTTIEHLSYHDKLTGLYNRRYYEEQLPLFTTKKYMPLSVLICDLNALKLANDAFGHDVGDQVIKAAADVLLKHQPPKSVIARTGGDEFVVLLPNTPYSDAITIMDKMKKASLNKEISHMYLSMSFGLATLESRDESFNMIYRRAENKLYAYKLKEGDTVRRNILDAIVKKVFTKYPVEKTHAEQVSAFAVKLGKKAGINEQGLDTLKQIAFYHDIGKIGVDEDIISKPSALSDMERLDMDRHPEIGYRLLISLPDKAHLAEHVLNHHENIDGSGYPRRLTGERISKYSKIIRICESYDTMIHDQIYQKAMSKEAAIKNLKAGIGTFYDETLTQLFIEMVGED